MDYTNILNQWAKFSDYDREKQSIKLNRKSYELYKINETNKNILENYDNTGMLCVLYTRIKYIELLKDIDISLYDAIYNMKDYEKELNMISLLSSTEILKIEQDIIERINKIYLDITKNKLLGDTPNNKEIILKNFAHTLEDVKKLNTDVFKKGGLISDITINPNLHIFERISECLIVLEQANDGLYFCFIKAGNTADCFFTFILKNNGNIIAMNDRVDEAYIGQHSHTRNGRWTEGKADKIFPYEKIFNYSNYDYKGYAKNYEINTEINLFDLGVDTFTPIIISMLLIIIKYNNKNIETDEIKYIDTFIGKNKNIAIKEGLIKYQDSSLISINDNIDLSFDTDKIINYTNEFSRKNNENLKWDEAGSFGDNQIFIDMYAKGFKPDEQSLFSGSNIRKIGVEGSAYTPEFIATKEKMRLQVYKELREQLANYIREEIYKEYLSYGGIDKIKEWYTNEIINNLGRIYALIISSEGQSNIAQTKAKISIGEGKWPDGIRITKAINVDNPEEYIYNCKITGKPCNYWIKIMPYDWNDLEFILNQEVPKTVKGWLRNGHRCSGNPILDATDAVGNVKTPFEERYSGEIDEERYSKAEYNFDITLGFSKSGWNKIIKTYRRLKDGK